MFYRYARIGKKHHVDLQKPITRFSNGQLCKRQFWMNGCGVRLYHTMTYAAVCGCRDIETENRRSSLEPAEAPQAVLAYKGSRHSKEDVPKPWCLLWSSCIQHPPFCWDLEAHAQKTMQAEALADSVRSWAPIPLAAATPCDWGTK